jgi:hypothetical protein
MFLHEVHLSKIIERFGAMVEGAFGKGPFGLRAQYRPAGMDLVVAKDHKNGAE